MYDVEIQPIIFGIVHVRRLHLVYGGKENHWTYVKGLFKMMGSITTKEMGWMHLFGERS